MLVLTACGSAPKEESFFGDRRVAYKKSIELKGIDVPPGLDAGNIQDMLVVPGSTMRVEKYSNYNQQQPKQVTDYHVLPKIENISVKRDKNQRWLLVSADPNQLWSKISLFWKKQGFSLDQEMPEIGLLETNWMENRADIQEGAMRNTLKKMFDWAYSAKTRDRYRTRLERGALPDTTEIYITHRGLKEVGEEKTHNEGGGNISWKVRAAEPELEAEMIYRLLMYLGKPEDESRYLIKQAESNAIKSKLVNQDNTLYLNLDESFVRSWRFVGIVLDRMGLTIDDKNRDLGMYYIQQELTSEAEKAKKWSFWNNEKSVAKKAARTVSLVKERNKTNIYVLDENGNRLNDQHSKDLLKELGELLG